jgi:hypothetical protein
MSSEPNPKVPEGRRYPALPQEVLNELCNAFGYFIVLVRKQGVEGATETLRKLSYSDTSSFDEKTGRD